MEKKLLEKLKRTVQWAEGSAFYKSKLSKKGITGSKIKTIDDFKNVPPITAEELRKNSKKINPLRKEKIYSLYATGGTTGKPKLIYYDEEALEGVADATAQGLKQIFNLEGKFVILIVPADNLAAVGEYTKRALRNLKAFSGSMGLTYTPAQNKQLVSVMLSERPYLIIGNPARLQSLIHTVRELGLNPKSLGIKNILSTSEVLTKNTRNFLSKEFGAQIYQGGGMSEVGWSTMECKYRNGQHILSNVYAEIIDIQNGMEIKEGVGELYVSTLVNKAYPLLRYKTEDIVEVTYKKCPCGISGPRIWYKCRLSESVVIETVSIFAYHIDKVLEKVPQVTTNFSFVVEKEKEKKVTIRLRVECEKKYQKEIYSTKIKKELLKNIPGLGGLLKDKKIHDIFIEFVNIDALERTPRGKVALRISDQR